MPSERSRVAVIDIIHNAALAIGFISDLDRQTFAADVKTFYATTRCLEVISEAARRLDVDVQNRHPHLGWRHVFAAGNVYRHEYDNVLPTLVWNAVHEDIPPLIDAMRQELERD